MFGYVTTLRSMSRSRLINYEFDHYDIVPPNVAQAIVRLESNNLDIRFRFWVVGEEIPIDELGRFVSK